MKNHHIIRSLLSVALGFLTLAPAVAAQNVGDRVRVDVSSGVTYVGEVTRVDGMGITIDMGEQIGSREIPSSDIENIERSVGTGNRAVPGAVIGGLVGAAVAAAKGWASFSAQGVEVAEASNRSDGRALASIAGGALVVGGLGALIKADRWEEIPLGEQVSLRPVLNAGFDRHAEPPTLLFGARIRF